MSTLSRPHPGPSCGPRSILLSGNHTHILQLSGQPISFPPSSLTLRETTSQRVTRAVAWCCSSEMTWCALSPLWPLYRRFLISRPDLSVEHALFRYNRKRAVNTNFTPNSNHMNQSLTTSSLSRLKRRSTRFDGANDRTLHISYSQRMVRLCPIIYVAYVRSLIRAFYVGTRRQDDQAMESLRKVVASGVRI